MENKNVTKNYLVANYDEWKVISIDVRVIKELFPPLL